MLACQLNASSNRNDRAHIIWSLRRSNQRRSPTGTRPEIANRVMLGLRVLQQPVCHTDEALLHDIGVLRKVAYKFVQFALLGREQLHLQGRQLLLSKCLCDCWKRKIALQAIDAMSQDHLSVRFCWNTQNPIQLDRTSLNANGASTVCAFRSAGILYHILNPPLAP